MFEADSEAETLSLLIRLSSNPENVRQIITLALKAAWASGNLAGFREGQATHTADNTPKANQVTPNPQPYVQNTYKSIPKPPQNP